VVDPFAGTGALLAEAGLMGARISGGDADTEMIRGAMANFAFLKLDPELLKVVDAGTPFRAPGDHPWDALVTDPPYGRASGTSGEAPARLLQRSLAAWAAHLRPEGWMCLVAPSTAPTDLGPGWTLVETIAHRVHRSLTREFRTYRPVPRSAVS
jgi:tRNA (guanine10-N2)-dimethyltransferase